MQIVTQKGKLWGGNYIADAATKGKGWGIKAAFITNHADLKHSCIVGVLFGSCESFVFST